MMRGRFITFEGGEGCGKSTQARLLASSLQSGGIEVVLTREPGGTPGAERIRDLLLAPDAPDWGPRAEALLFAAARSDHVFAAIQPALERGAWVVCDRFVDSTRAYQGGEGDLRDEDILALHRVGSNNLLPDLTILLSAQEDVLTERLRLRDGDQSDRIGGREIAFHRRVAARFAAMAVEEPARFVTVSAAGSPEAVQGRVMAAIGERLGLPA